MTAKAHKQTGNWAVDALEHVDNQNGKCRRDKCNANHAECVRTTFHKQLVLRHKFFHCLTVGWNLTFKNGHQRFRHGLEQNCAHTHYAQRDGKGKFEGLVETLFLVCAVVVGKDWHCALHKSKHRHKDE